MRRFIVMATVCLLLALALVPTAGADKGVETRGYPVLHATVSVSASEQEAYGLHAVVYREDGRRLAILPVLDEGFGRSIHYFIADLAPLSTNGAHRLDVIAILVGKIQEQVDFPWTRFWEIPSFLETAYAVPTIVGKNAAPVSESFMELKTMLQKKTDFEGQIVAKGITWEVRKVRTKFCQ